MDYATGQTAVARYEQGQSDRSAYDREAKDCSKLTIPYLYPETNTGKHTKIKTPFQAVGARGVNSLASKLLIALLPPGTPFFKLSIDSLELMKEGQEGLETEIDKGLRVIENALMNEI